jgi:hypothetical protein
MITHINYEVFSPAMKARLDPTYRRILQAEQHPRSYRSRKNASPSGHKTALPFTTKTRAYGTYVERKG